MKVTLKARSLQFFLSKYQDRGNVWSVILFFILVLGVLTAIALPTLFAKIRKAKQVEARQTLGLLYRAQKQYFKETGTLAHSSDRLEFKIKPEGMWYRYRMLYASDRGPFQLRNGNLFPPQRIQSAFFTAQPKESGLKSYSGGLFVVTTSSGKTTTIAGICETNLPSIQPPDLPKLSGENPGVILCPSDSSLLGNYR